MKEKRLNTNRKEKKFSTPKKLTSLMYQGSQKVRRLMGRRTIKLLKMALKRFLR